MYRKCPIGKNMYIGSYVVNLPYLPQPVISNECSRPGWGVGRCPHENAPTRKLEQVFETRLGRWQVFAGELVEPPYQRCSLWV